MKKLERHPFPADLVDEFIEGNGDSLQKALTALQQGNPAAIDHLSSSGYSYAACVALRDLNSPDVCRGLKISAAAGAAMFERARQDSGEVDVRIPGVAPQRAPATGATSTTSAGRWWVAFCCAAIVRDHASLDALASFPIPRLAASRTKSFDCVFRQAEMMQAFWLRRADVSPLLVRAVEATEPKPGWHPDQTDHILDLTIQELELVYKAIKGDAAAYTEKLVFALGQHKRYWGKPKRARDPQGFLALGLLGVDSVVRELGGLNVTVDSDYFPMTLANGACA